MRGRASARSVISAILIAGVVSTASAPAEAKSKSAGMAFLLSLASTLVPIAITTVLWTTGDGLDEDVRLGLGMTFLGVGSIVGPSVGALYAGETGEAMLTMLLRGATGSVMLSGLGVYSRGGEDKETLGLALTTVGAVPTGLIAIYDLWTAPKKARDSNRASRTVAEMEEELRSTPSSSWPRVAGSIIPGVSPERIEPTLSFSRSLRLRTFR